MGDVPGDNTNTQNYNKALELKGIDLSNMSPATGDSNLTCCLLEHVNEVSCSGPAKRI